MKPLRLKLRNLDATHAPLILANHPSREDLGSRSVSFSNELYIDTEDFREEANKKYKRLVLGKRVRLRGAYVVEAVDMEKDEEGNITAVIADAIEGSLGEDPPDGVKPKGVIHWVDAATAVAATVRVYDRLFTDPAPDRGSADYMEFLNPESLSVIDGAMVEASLVSAAAEDRFQFEREGYFIADRYDHSADAPLFNQVIGLRDVWAQRSA